MFTAHHHDNADGSTPDAAPIRSNVPGSFAWGVLHRRHPALIQQVRNAHPYPPEHHQALDHLLDEITTGRIQPLPDTVHDHADWQRWDRDHIRRPWPDVPFLWAESYFYRRLLHAVGYFEPGPWHSLDPFEPAKSAELADPSLATDLAALAQLSRSDRSAALMDAALWGNRADLGFRMSDPASASRRSMAHLVADDSGRLWEHLDSNEPGTVCVVADNAGRELLADLVLIDHLLDTGKAAHVELHLKPHPYYVSDATTADLVSCLRRLTTAPESAREVGQRLWQAINTGRLVIHVHPFYCAPLPYHHMPPDLHHRFASARLTIMKGDLNYRRLVGDCHWQATTSFAALTSYFPGPVAALRTLKSDVAVGIDQDTLTALDATGHAWRTSGTHALIQTRL